jgi:hypothetical protein
MNKQLKVAGDLVRLAVRTAFKACGKEYSARAFENEE